MGLSLTDVSFTYQGATSRALSDVDLALEPGRFYGVMGATGAGKSTLCHVFSGLVPHFIPGRLAGSVRLDGEESAAIPIDVLATRVGYVGGSGIDVVATSFPLYDAARAYAVNVPGAAATLTTTYGGLTVNRLDVVLRPDVLVMARLDPAP